MNSKHIFTIAALVAAGAATAQTVPAEAWVGAPINDVVGLRSRADVSAEARQVAASAQAPQELWVGSADSAADHTGATSRSEVVADFRDFQRAGLADIVNHEGFDPSDSQYQRRFAQYMQLRAAQRQAASSDAPAPLQVVGGAMTRAPQ